ncbi:hypothetical protein [Nocardioides albus]|uniref:Uncharacterized protein n=1 Tax=Nocardioides albus TaxID=1841 RepID=A0A7W5FBK8_9ACTN|nr:hypothetical protein [Nocardioides albus]MBB3092291.1 hypothetical protein [Nocardioides albus]GGU26371.1 hypothetical protein GCM10007979_26670 [Nocardioides albus]
MSDDDVATEDEVQWALAGDSAAPADAVDEVLTSLRATGRTREVGVDVLRAAAFRLVSEDRLDDVGRSWLELLDAVRAHPDARLADLPPARTD